MKKLLKSLKFQYNPQEGCEAWYKVYKGFVLFIVQAPNNKILSAITVKGLEISLPNIPNIDWIVEFDKENT